MSSVRGVAVHQVGVVARGIAHGDVRHVLGSEAVRLAQRQQSIHRPVLIPFAEGPIDVDRQVDWDLANRIIAEREQG